MWANQDVCWLFLFHFKNDETPFTLLNNLQWITINMLTVLARDVVSYPQILYEVDLFRVSRRLIKQCLSYGLRRRVFDVVQYCAPARYNHRLNNIITDASSHASVDVLLSHRNSQRHLILLWGVPLICT